MIHNEFITIDLARQIQVSYEDSDQFTVKVKILIVSTTVVIEQRLNILFEIS